MKDITNVYILQADGNKSHSHGITDNGHSHGINDSGHSHPIKHMQLTGTCDWGADTFRAGGEQTRSTESATTGITIKSGKTNITINNNGITEARPINATMTIWKRIA